MFNLTHRERVLYVELIGKLAAIGTFCGLTGVTFSNPHRVAVAAFLSFLLGFLVPQLYFFCYWHDSPRDAHEDERDRLIELRGIRSGYTVLFAGIVFVFFYLGFIHSSTGAGQTLALIFAVWMLSQIVKVARQLELYRTQDGWLADRLKPLLYKRAMKRMEELKQKRMAQ